MTGSYHRLRRITGAVLLLILVGLPFLRINGQSAIRFDVPTLQLLFFGSRTGLADFFVVLAALIFLAFLTIFITTLFGRIWCGWLCPQTVILDATGFLEQYRLRGPALRIALSAATLAVSSVIAASLIGYFIDPYELPALLRSGGTASRIITWSWISITVLLALDLTVLRRRFCATVCPYARMQGVLFDDRTLLVAFDATRARECMDCKACVRACPVGIDIRKGTQAACIHCAECVDACTKRMAGKGRTLIDYSFGPPGTDRPRSLLFPFLSGGLTVLALLFLVYLIGSKSTFDLGVRILDPSGPVVRSGGTISNRYELSFRNKTEKDLNLMLSVAAPSGAGRISPASLTLPANGNIVRVQAVITLPDAGGSQDRNVTLTALVREDGTSVVQEVHFMMPEQK